MLAAPQQVGPASTGWWLSLGPEYAGRGRYVAAQGTGAAVGGGSLVAAQEAGAAVDGGGSLVAAQEAGAAVGGGSLAAAEEDGGDGDEVVDHTSAALAIC
jgi:hypothetical protein